MNKRSFPTFSKYEILGVLGEGSMGAVYKARHKLLDRVVALKVPHPSMLRNATQTERFLREGRALAMLRHPNVVDIYDTEEEDALPYIAMEFVDGNTLSSEIRSNKHLPFTDIKQWATQIAGALDYIYAQGMLHRDLKSSNVLISNDRRALITDFGIAHLDSQATITNGMLGTPAYMSPEQAKGEKLDGSSDLYSLGVVLYEACTGHIPFYDENSLALIQKIIHEQPPALTTVRPDVPAQFARIVHKLLAKEPTQRYQRGADLVRDLENVDVRSVGHIDKPSLIQHGFVGKQKMAWGLIIFSIVILVAALFTRTVFNTVEDEPAISLDARTDSMEVNADSSKANASTNSNASSWQPWP